MIFSLFVIGIALYHKVVYYDFVSYDDTIYMSALYDIFSKGGVLLWTLTEVVNSNWSPVTLLSLALDYKLYGLNAGGFHVTSLLLHSFNTALVFLIINSIFEDKNKSFFITLLFLIHPLNVETVVWVSERKGMLAALFTLLSLYFFLKFNQGNYKKIFYSLSLASFCLALLAKAVFVALPLIFILIEWYICKAKARDFYLAKTFYNAIPFLLVSLLIGTLTIWVHSATGAIASNEINPIHHRLGNAVTSFLIYLKQLFYPFQLTVMYRYKIIPIHIVIGSIVIISGMAFVVYNNRIKRPYLLFSILWYTLFLLPVLGIIQSGYHAHADRYAYIPLIGAYIAIVFLFSEFIKWINIRPIIIRSAVSMFIVMLMFISWVQISTWKNTLYLFQHTLTIDSDNYAANTNLAVFLMLNGNIPKGMEHYNRARKITPFYINMYDTISRNLTILQKPDMAVKVLYDLISNHKNFVRAYIKIAKIRINQQQYLNAKNILLKAIKIVKTDKTKTEINYLLAYSYLNLNQKELAIAILRDSVKIGEYGDKVNIFLNELIEIKN